MTQRKIELAKRNGTIEYYYNQLVKKKVRRKYSLEDELAIVFRKPELITEHEAYVDECKAEARAELGL